MFVYATIEVQTEDGASAPRLAVPVAAVAEMDGSAVVFVQVEERSFEIRSIDTGESAGEWVEVRSGLTEGESIAVAGIFTLKSEVQKGGLEGHEH
jgi:cobalt-zinc-cadmium efflux system membrane fusion protein